MLGQQYAVVDEPAASTLQPQETEENWLFILEFWNMSTKLNKNW